MNPSILGKWFDWANEVLKSEQRKLFDGDREKYAVMDSHDYRFFSFGPSRPSAPGQLLAGPDIITVHLEKFALYGPIRRPRISFNPIEEGGRMPFMAVP